MALDSSPIQMLESAKRAQTWRLTLLIDDEMKKLAVVRGAHWLAWLVVCVCAVRILAGSDAALVSLDALVWLSWIVGSLVTLSVAKHWKALQVPLLALAEECGLLPAQQAFAAPLALWRRLLLTLGLPLLTVTGLALALSPDLTQAVRGAQFIAMSVLYVFTLALGLMLLTVGCARLANGATRTWLVAVLLMPELLRELWPHTPSVLSVYAWMVHQVARAGGIQ